MKGFMEWQFCLRFSLTYLLTTSTCKPVSTGCGMLTSNCVYLHSDSLQRSQYTGWRTLYRKSDLCIPRNKTARLHSQLLHSCICERFIYSQDRSAYLAAWMWKLEDRTVYFCFGNYEAAQFHFWEYINRNQTFIHIGFLLALQLQIHYTISLLHRETTVRDQCDGEYLFRPWKLPKLTRRI